jgi:hypothetical protein
MAPSVDLGLEALSPARRSDGGDDGVAHHPSGTANPSFTMSGNPPASTTSSSGSVGDGSPPVTTSSSSNTGAIAGGVVGAVAALALSAGLFLWWWRRRRTNAKNARVLKEKLDLDSEDVDARGELSLICCKILLTELCINSHSSSRYSSCSTSRKSKTNSRIHILSLRRGNPWS